MLFCLSALRIWTHTVYWKGHPLWLLSHWEPTCHTADMTLFECSVYMWSELQQAPKMTKWLGVSKQPTNRPVLLQTGSWEQQRRCLVSSASSARCLPASSQQPCLMVCTTPCWTAVLISVCDTSVACHVVLSVCELSAMRANVLLIPLFVFTNRARTYKQASMVCIVWKVRRSCELLCAPVQLVPQAINPHSFLQMCRL